MIIAIERHTIINFLNSFKLSDADASANLPTEAIVIIILKRQNVSNYIHFSLYWMKLQLVTNDEGRRIPFQIGLNYKALD